MGGHAAVHRVSEMPKGWVMQSSIPYALVIAPAHDLSTKLGSCIGKLVVMLQSRDATSPAPGHAAAGERASRQFDVQGDTQILTFQIAGAQWVVTQAPVSLGWDSAELAKFASGVQVLVTCSRGAAEPSCRYDRCRRGPHGGSRPCVQVGYGVGRPR